MSSNVQSDETGTFRPNDVPFADPEEDLDAMQDVFGRKWQPIIVYYLLHDGAMRFNDLKGTIDDVSAKMLSESLDHLEERGLVERTLLNDRPVQVEYALTERGEALRPIVSAMLSWESEYGLASPSE